MRIDSAFEATVNTAALLAPAGVLIVIFRTPTAAFDAMISWNVTNVGPACNMLPTVMPVPETSRLAPSR